MSRITDVVDHYKARLETVLIANGYQTDLGALVEVSSAGVSWDATVHFAGTTPYGPTNPQHPYRVNIAFSAVQREGSEDTAYEHDFNVVLIIEAAKFIVDPTADLYTTVYKPMHEDLIKMIEEAPPLNSLALSFSPKPIINLLDSWYHERHKELFGVIMQLTIPITELKGL